MDNSTLQGFMPGADLAQAAALAILLITGLVLMLIDAFGGRRLLPGVTALGLAVSSAVAWFGNPEYTLIFSDMIAVGGVASLFHIFLCISGLFALFFIDDFLNRHDKLDRGDVYPLLVFSVIGMVMLSNGNDLAIVFIGLEIMSICFYVMAGLFPRDIASNEAAMKYFLLGSFASAFLLYGIALLYGLSGSDPINGPTTKLHLLGRIMTENAYVMTENLMFYPAIGLILIGFLFKVAAFPFHSWTPDVYSGAPTPLAGFMATGGKMAAFIAFSMFMLKLMPMADEKIINLLILLAILSMYYGNIVAVQQKNIKRLLAYSSIAHTGYMLLGMCAGSVGYMAVIFYMFIYTLMTIGAFGIIAMVESRNQDAELVNWKGLGLRQPWLGFTMAVFMLSLAGMPPLGGFIGKYMIFASAVKSEFYVASVLGILSSIIGAYYYLRVIVVMYFEKAEDPEALAGMTRKTAPLLGALLLVVLLLTFGLNPSSVASYLDTLYSNAGFMSVTASLP